MRLPFDPESKCLCENRIFEWRVYFIYLEELVRLCDILLRGHKNLNVRIVVDLVELLFKNGLVYW